MQRGLALGRGQEDAQLFRFERLDDVLSVAGPRHELAELQDWIGWDQLVIERRVQHGPQRRVDDPQRGGRERGLSFSHRQEKSLRVPTRKVPQPHAAQHLPATDRERQDVEPQVVAFYNGRGTAEQWIKEGKNAVKWTRLSCTSFRANAVRLELHALAYNLANFLRTLALPREVADWSLMSLREKVVKIGAKVVAHGRYLVFQMAEVAVPRELFRGILDRIAGLRPAVVVRC